MTAEAVGRHMPPVVTLDDLAAMMTAGRYGHRYEMSSGGGVFITPPPDSKHAEIASALMFWFAAAGWTSQQVLQAVGLRIPGPGGDGGRIPDLTVWSKPQPHGVWLTLTDLLVVVEIVSPGSEAMDELVKRREYAQAGIPRYWLVDRDKAQTVTLYGLGASGEYDVVTKCPLAWLLNTAPAEHLG
jgi:Uma2 family endonuclease